MSLVGSQFGNLPGQQAIVESFEQAFCWGPYPRYYVGAYISSTASDATNVPTSTLRMGLVMGKVTATGLWTNYSPTATDGSQIAQGVLPLNLRLQDALTGVNTTKFYSVMVSGGVKGATLIGLDNQARAQMAKTFLFDDNLPGSANLDWITQIAKTANYTIVASDNFTEFNNTGAVGAVTFTLPAIANGYQFGFRLVADQNLLVTSAEGANMVAFNNAAASTVSFQTGGNKIGGGFRIYSNPAGTKWFVENISAGANTVTVA